MKNIHLFLDVFVLCSIIFHTWISGVRDNVTEIKAVIFNFFIYLLIILLVSLVSVVSFPPFRFVVSGFSTHLQAQTVSKCLKKMHLPDYPLLPSTHYMLTLRYVTVMYDMAQCFCSGFAKTAVVSCQEKLTKVRKNSEALTTLFDCCFLVNTAVF